MRYSIIRVPGRANLLDIPLLFTFCMRSFFMIQQIGGKEDRKRVKIPRGGDIGGRFLDTQVLAGFLKNMGYSLIE